MGQLTKVYQAVRRGLMRWERGQLTGLGGSLNFGGEGLQGMQLAGLNLTGLQAGITIGTGALGQLNLGGNVGTITPPTVKPVTTGPGITGPTGPVNPQKPPTPITMGPPPPPPPPPPGLPPPPSSPGFLTAPQTFGQVGARVTDCASFCHFEPVCMAACTATTVVAPTVTQAARTLGQNIVDQFTSKGIPPAAVQPSRLPPGPPPSFRPSEITTQPQNVPTLDQKTPCPACDRLGQQRQQLEHELQTEQQQQLEKQLTDQQQQLDLLAELEKQPSQFRNIPQELAQKRQLLQQIDQQIQQLEQQQQQQQQQLETTPTTRTPTTRPGEVPTLQQPAGELAQQNARAAKQLEQLAQLEQPQPQPQQPSPQPSSSKQGVTFCVGCASEEDAILFLNGEPGQCSVIPGSTKMLQLGA